MDTWNSPRILFQVAHTPATHIGGVRSNPNFSIIVRDTHLPCYISEGELYVQAPFRHVVEAIVEAISESFRNLEVGVSIANSAPLSLDRVWGPVSEPRMAEPDVVRSGEQS